MSKHIVAKSIEQYIAHLRAIGSDIFSIPMARPKTLKKTTLKSHMTLIPLDGWQENPLYNEKFITEAEAMINYQEHPEQYS